MNAKIQIIFPPKLSDFRFMIKFMEVKIPSDVLDASVFCRCLVDQLDK